MCNNKGWDIVYYPEKTTIQKHFCRVYGDCGHVDNTLEEVADEIAAFIRKQHSWYTKTCIDGYDQARMNDLLLEAEAWEKRTHTDYLYSKE